MSVCLSVYQHAIACVWRLEDNWQDCVFLPCGSGRSRARWQAPLLTVSPAHIPFSHEFLGSNSDYLVVQKGPLLDESFLWPSK